MRLVSSRPQEAIRRFTFIAPLSVDSEAGIGWRPQAVDAARQRLFEDLDGRTVTVRGGTWEIRVYGISVEPGAWWIQLSLEGSPEYTVTMRTPLLQTAHDTLCRLARWLADPSEADRTLTIA
jgi:hypothetical protein